MIRHALSCTLSSITQSLQRTRDDPCLPSRILSVLKAHSRKLLYYVLLFLLLALTVDPEKQYVMPLLGTRSPVYGLLGRGFRLLF